jgi:hypothetical protein
MARMVQLAMNIPLPLGKRTNSLQIASGNTYQLFTTWTDFVFMSCSGMSSNSFTMCANRMGSS